MLIFILINPINQIYPLGLFWGGNDPSIADRPFNPPPGYIPPKPAPNGLFNQLLDSSIENSQNGWNRIPPAFQYLMYGVSSAIIAPSIIPVAANGEFQGSCRLKV
ncbi:MAG: hypothetical protein QM500_13715 [Methylococcales bacterium]